MEKRKCSICKESRPLEDFYKRWDKKGKGIGSNCRQCIVAGNRKRREANPRQFRDYDLKRHFGKGFGCDQYDEMFSAQDSKCSICKLESKENLYVDHCHKTMVIRGLLCHSCNLGLGKFKDSVESLNRAIEYLSEAKDKKLMVTGLKAGIKSD